MVKNKCFTDMSLFAQNIIF
uniref:Uncharacterized protein n=1 Tax=Anguilla anguilla TaxID=7936 RepID=A0A0E9RJ34_ANGAN